MTAARLIQDRISPVRRGRPVYLELPSVKTAADVSAALAALTMAMAAGDVTPDEAATVSALRRTSNTEACKRRNLNCVLIRGNSNRLPARSYEPTWLA